MIKVFYLHPTFKSNFLFAWVYQTFHDHKINFRNSIRYEIFHMSIIIFWVQCMNNNMFITINEDHAINITDNPDINYN